MSMEGCDDRVGVFHGPLLENWLQLDLEVWLNFCCVVEPRQEANLRGL